MICNEGVLDYSFKLFFLPVILVCWRGQNVSIFSSNWPVGNSLLPVSSFVMLRSVACCAMPSFLVCSFLFRIKLFCTSILMMIYYCLTVRFRTHVMAWPSCLLAILLFWIFCMVLSDNHALMVLFSIANLLRSRCECMPHPFSTYFLMSNLRGLLEQWGQLLSVTSKERRVSSVLSFEISYLDFVSFLF